MIKKKDKENIIKYFSSAFFGYYFFSHIELKTFHQAITNVEMTIIGL